MESERVRDQRLHDSIIEENLRRTADTEPYDSEGLAGDTGYCSHFFGPAAEVIRRVNDVFLHNFHGEVIAKRAGDDVYFGCGDPDCCDQ